MKSNDCQFSSYPWSYPFLILKIMSYIIAWSVFKLGIIGLKFQESKVETGAWKFDDSQRAIFCTTILFAHQEALIRTFHTSFLL